MPDRVLPVIQPGKAPDPPPIFEKVAIIGLGLIGGSIALACRQRWPASLVIAVDDKSVLEKAMVLHAIDVAADDLIVTSEADLVILAAPVLENIALLEKLPEQIDKPTVVTDVGSTKRRVVEAARSLPARFTFVGGHPLGGAAKHGIEFARSDLFTGRPWIFTPDSDRAGAALEQLMAFASALGSTPSVMTAVEHDRVLASISHLPQLVASALMHVVGEQAGVDGLRLSGRGLADTTRLASSSAAVWADVLRTNADFVGGVLDEFIEELQALRDGLDARDTIDEVFVSANQWRERLMAGRDTPPEV
ncbi:MAG: prephenate dehydrogenase/arogenate dehydrogenase family protein [Acidobacteria bacterium]|nr:prephenate dehydrogenase/arogenate dehydrogenase family protein [Acidobacteriota bacterium]